MEYVIEPARICAIDVDGMDAKFPVRRIYCVGRNFADHAIEMGHDPDREPPFFFQKNAQNADNSGVFPYPDHSDDVHFEIEMVVALKSGGRNIALDDALTHVFGYGVGLDMTRRDLQGQMKKMGRPWEIGKAFEHSAPMGALVPASEIGHPDSGEISLSINGDQRQVGDLNQMIWKLPEMIQYLSQYFEVGAGDLIMCGTPAGVGAIKRGDKMFGTIAGVGELSVNVV
ncbi:fumarylacetoacetase [Amylibacter ulvae]|uniref:Fumarylacetoacetase n=1 Tax=Paramylibacter ulvae TaxID=1651968 RepID=A0ABQ3CV18_9RHOB|nr:fumarylacetoacetate hydrolase family protein [Amylibacter ulvae]GHA45273.1 fumarylacetoacetase [Amylibacter ulvae]